ncbi:MAG: GtrA family protein [Clostridia bacterium]|jgi:gtrA family protein
MIVDKVEEFCLKILEKIGLKALADWYRKHQEGMRYLVFGALTTIVNILVYTIFSALILKGLTNDSLRVNISEIIAFIAGVVFAYITNKLYVFNSKTTGKKDLFREIASFFSCRIFTEIISILMMNAAVWFSINDILMKVVSNIVVIILNFVFSKILIFKGNKNLK